MRLFGDLFQVSSIKKRTNNSLRTIEDSVDEAIVVPAHGETCGIDRDAGAHATHVHCIGFNARNSNKPIKSRLRPT